MDLTYLLALLKTPQVGVTTFYKALKHFTDATAIFQATQKELIASNVFKDVSIDFIINFDEQKVIADLNWSTQSNCEIISFIDDKYPSILKNMYDPPPVLYAKGDLALMSSRQLAVVGSRNPTTTGVKNAYNFAKELSDNITITSGLAIGIDSAAHNGAVSNNCKTVAVCATGLDIIYPARNKNLARTIADNGGLLLSEFPIGTQANAKNFPKRNRVIAGLSDGLLVVEAAKKSGSMISAKSAIEQNKDVFAIPGSIYNPLKSGCHALIKDGAYLVESAEDIKQLLHIDYKKITKNNKHAPQINNVLLKYLDYDGLTIDELIIKSNLSVQDVSRLLLQLELDDVVEKTIHNTYILKN